MKWTDVKPSKPGWWWCWRSLGPEFPICVYVYLANGGWFAQLPDDRLMPISEMAGQWSDAPIEEPKEA